jgi:hypothetical protein
MVRGLRPGDPQRIGPYELTGVLGSGGMGQVFLGLSPGGRPVAVKVIRAELADDPEFRNRFRREVAAAQKVNGLFTAAVAGADADAPLPWLATVYVPGPSLAQAVAEHGPLPPGAVLALTAGLTAIHAAGVVHRDLKPSNVLLAADGPRVIDFGISRASETSALTNTGLVVGSPGFMSPEQAEGGEIGPASDVFSLGAVLTFAATGQGPFGGGMTAALVYRVVHASPSLEQVPEAIRPLIQRCLDKDPARRPTPRDLLHATSTMKPAEGWLPEPVIGVIAQHSLPGRPDEARTATAMNVFAPPLATVQPQLQPGATVQPQLQPGATVQPQLQRNATARPGHAAGKPRRRSRRLLAAAAIAACLVVAAVAIFVLGGGSTKTPPRLGAAAVPTGSQAARSSSLPVHGASPTPAAARTPAPTAASTPPGVSPSVAPAAVSPPATRHSSSPAHSASPSPSPAANPGQCQFGSLCPAVSGTMSGGAMTEQYANDGYTHVAGLSTPPAALTISIGEIPAAGTYTLTIFYENSTGSDGLTEPRDMSLLVNGHLSGVLNFAVTSSWYETASDSTTASVEVPSGLSTFSIACQSGDSCHVNLWKIKLAQ